jgi:hypothetical protein
MIVVFVFLVSWLFLIGTQKTLPGTHTKKQFDFESQIMNSSIHYILTFFCDCCVFVLQEGTQSIETTLCICPGKNDK